MASISKFSYHRLIHDREFDEADQESAFRKTEKWYKISKFKVRKRRKLRIPGLRRLLRKKSAFLARVKGSWKTAMRRLKNGQVHLNDLFGGRYLYIQGSHTPLRCRGHRPIVIGHGFHGLPSSRYPIGKIA